MASIQGWGRQTWNNGTWGEFGTVDATGSGLSTSLGSITVSTQQNLTPTGIALTSTIADVTATGIANADPTGLALTWQPIGTYTVQSDFIFPITGVSSTLSVGTTSQSADIRVGWNRDANLTTGAAIGWGDEAWGAVNNPATNVTGFGLTSGLGSPTITTDQIISPSGNALSLTIGPYAISADGNLTVAVGTENLLNLSLGTGYSVGAGPDVSVTGFGLTSSLGTVETSQFVTGFGLTSSVGQATQESAYDVTGVQGTSNVGQVQIEGSAVFTLTGVSATSSVGQFIITGWSEVDDSNSGISWKEVPRVAA